MGNTNHENSYRVQHMETKRFCAIQTDFGFIEALVGLVNDNNDLLKYFFQATVEPKLPVGGA